MVAQQAENYAAIAAKDSTSAAVREIFAATFALAEATIAAQPWLFVKQNQ